MMKVSAGSLTKMRAMAEKAMNRVRAVRAQGEAMMEEATRTAVISGTAFSLGVIQGKTGGIELAGLPLDLLVGAGAHVAGFMKLGGKASAQMHNVGNGALALYAGTMGRSIGVQWKTTGRLGGGAKASGSLPEAGTDYMSDADMARSVLRR